MGLQKAVKPEFGSGSRSFSCEEDYIYENIESELCFFTSQVLHNIEHKGFDAALSWFFSLVIKTVDDISWKQKKAIIILSCIQ